MPQVIAINQDPLGVAAVAVAASEVRPSFAYSRPVHSFHARRDRVVLLPPCSLYGAATLRPTPLGPGRGLTLPCGWNNAGSARATPRVTPWLRGSPSRTSGASSRARARRSGWTYTASRPATWPARALLPESPIPPRFPVLARACLWCLVARMWRVTLP